MRILNTIQVPMAVVVVWGIMGHAYGQKQNDCDSAFFGPVPTSIGVKKFGDRLLSGQCNLHITCDSLFSPGGGERMYAGFLRNIPVPSNGVILEQRSGNAIQNYGILTFNFNIPNAGRTMLEPEMTTMFPFSIHDGIVHEPRTEYAFTGDIVDHTNLYCLLFRGQDNPSYRSWADWSWIGQSGMTCRVLYYKHERAPGAVELITLNSDVSSNPTITTMKTAPGVEGIGWTDIVVERADAASFTDSFGVYLRTATGYVETGPAGEEGLVLLGCRYWVPGLPGVQIGTFSYGSSDVSDHLNLNHMSETNLAKFVEACQIDTPVLWMHDGGTPAENASLVEQWAERMKQAINAARMNDPTIQEPMPVIVSTWPSPFPEVNEQVPALATMVSTHPDYVFININRLVEDTHGPWADWQAVFTVDGLHPSVAGSDEFSRLFFAEALTGGCREDITPSGGNGVVNIEDLVAVLNSFGPCPDPQTPCDADITPPGGNGVVNIDDLVMILSAFGSCS